MNRETFALFALIALGIACWSCSDPTAVSANRVESRDRRWGDLPDSAMPADSTALVLVTGEGNLGAIQKAVLDSVPGPPSVDSGGTTFQASIVVHLSNPEWNRTSRINSIILKNSSAGFTIERIEGVDLPIVIPNGKDTSITVVVSFSNITPRILADTLIVNERPEMAVPLRLIVGMIWVGDLDFGLRQEGGMIDSTIVIHNWSCLPATVSALRLTGTGASSYSLRNLPALPFVIPADSDFEATVRFSADSQGPTPATLTASIQGLGPIDSTGAVTGTGIP